MVLRDTTFICIYTGMLWHVTWFTQAHETNKANRFPPHSSQRRCDRVENLWSLKHSFCFSILFLNRCILGIQLYIWAKTLLVPDDWKFFIVALEKYLISKIISFLFEEIFIKPFKFNEKFLCWANGVFFPVNWVMRLSCCLKHSLIMRL